MNIQLNFLGFSLHIEGGMLVDYFVYSVACQFMLIVVLVTMILVIAVPGSPIANLPIQDNVDLLTKSASVMPS